tara:strand:+ start:220 stop:519 length:300 start_codon:yes stop_codon:yes gene_type:complete
MQIETGKNYYGKYAETEIKLKDNFILQITTMRRYSNKIVTSFTQWEKVSDNMSRNSGGETVFIDHGKQRLTDKKLLELHKKALEEKADYIATIKSIKLK